MPYLDRSFSAKEPYTQRLFCGKSDLQLKASHGSSPPFRLRYLSVATGIAFGEEERWQKRYSARGGGLGWSTIFKNLMSPTPRRKWYLTTGRRAH